MRSKAPVVQQSHQSRAAEPGFLGKLTSRRSCRRLRAMGGRKARKLEQHDDNAIDFAIAGLAAGVVEDLIAGQDAGQFAAAVEPK